MRISPLVKLLVLAVACAAFAGCNIKDPAANNTGNNGDNNGNNGTNNANNGTNNGNNGTNNANNGTNNANNANNGGCNLDCDHGACQIVDGTPTCECQVQYTGELCDECADGFQDNDGDGTCREGCNDGYCGANGTCEDDDGERACVCDTGYTGQFCGECDDDYQDEDGDGTCDISCDHPMAPECGQAFCDDTTGMVTCTCPDGTTYVSNGNRCDLEVPADPEFDDPVAMSPWTTVGDVTLAPGAAGVTDPGVAEFGQNACQNGGGVYQEYDLGTLDAVGQLKAVVTYAGECMFNCFEPTGVSFRFGDAFQRAGEEGFLMADATAEVCLGEAAHGVGTRLEVVSVHAPGSFTCNEQWLDFVDHVSYERAADGECPAPGTIPDGDFEAATSEWELDNSTDATTSTVDYMGSKVLEFRHNTRCESTSARNQFSVPGGTSGYALKFRHFGRQDDEYRVIVGTRGGNSNGYSTLHYIGTGQFEEESICLPSFMNGTVQGIEARMSTFGTCADPSGATARFDDFRIEEEPSCASMRTVLDPGFDASMPRAWTDRDTEGNNASIDTENGNDFASMLGEPCESPSFGQPIMVPRGRNAPNAVQYRVRYSDHSQTRASISLTGPHGSVSLENDIATTNGIWQLRQACIPDRYRGYPAELRFGLSGFGACADPPYGNRFDVDDVTLITAQSCN